jgi:phage-related protein
MPVHVSIATALDKGKLASDVVYSALLEVDILDRVTRTVSETLRLAHNNENIVFRGLTYQAAAFDFSVTRGKNELPVISLTIEDQTQVIQGLLQESQGGVDYPVRIYIVSSVNPDTPEMEENFTVIAAHTSSDSYAVTFDLGAENPLGLRFPAHMQFRNRCRWLYKSPQCGYAGSKTSCDLTFDGANGCKAHANALRYGGFPGIRRNGYR